MHAIRTQNIKPVFAILYQIPKQFMETCIHTDTQTMPHTKKDQDYKMDTRRKKSKNMKT